MSQLFFNLVASLMPAVLLFLAGMPVLAQTTLKPAPDPSTSEKSDRTTNLRIVYSAPAPLFETYYLINEATVQPADLAPLGAKVRTVSLGLGPMTDGGRLLFPSDTMADVKAVPEFLENANSVRREVVEERLPVLVSPYEYRFQYPYRGHMDCIQLLAREARPLGHTPDVRQVAADLVRYVSPDGRSVLALEMEPGHPFALEVAGNVRIGGVVSEVKTQDDTVRIYSLVRPLYRGSRVKAELRSMLFGDGSMSGEDEESVPTIYLRPGGGIPKDASEERRTVVATHIKDLAPGAIVPTIYDLWQGADELGRYVGSTGLPYVAANLLKAGTAPETERRLFPRFLVLQVGGLEVGVIGVVSLRQTGLLPPTVAKAWELLPLRTALEDAIDALHRHIGGRPDLTIVLLATNDPDEFDTAMGVGAVDIVLGQWAGWQAARTKRSLHFPVETGGRESNRIHDALYGVRASAISIGRLDVLFDVSGQGSTHRLRRVEDENWVVFDEGPRDAVLEAAIQRFEEDLYGRYFEVVLPDIEEIVSRHKELAPLVWGRRILFNQWYVTRTQAETADLTDPLLMRLATNVVRGALDAEVVISRNVALPSVQIGATCRGLLKWRLGILDTLELVSLTGADLIKVAERVRLQATEGRVAPDAHLFVSGLDPTRLKVAGRPIDPKEKYRVAATDYVTGLPVLQSMLSGKTRQRRFIEEGDGNFRPDADGEPLTIRSVVMRRIDAWFDEQIGAFSMAHLPELEDLFLDHSNRLVGRWRLQVRDLSFGGGWYANTPSAGPTGDFAASKDTRVVTPDNYSLRLGSDVSLDFDGPIMAWETGLQSKLQRTVLDVPGQKPVEPFDDLVAFTELRFNVLRMEAGGKAFPIVPYLRGTYDSELTANPGLPWQHLLRTSLGLVASPGTRLQEIRLGGVWQGDLSGDMTNDFGLAAGYRVAWPILPHLVWESTADVRYFFHDGDDAAKDLGLVLKSLNKLVVPVWGGVSLFGFADLHFVMGKTRPTNRQLGGSCILGAGLRFSDVWKF